MNFFSPIDIAKMQVENLADLTPQQKAGKLIVSQIKMGGKDYLMWSKYDEQGVLAQRVMLRKDLVDAENSSEPKVKLDPAEHDMKDFL